MPGWEQTDRVHKDVMYDVTSIPGKTPWSRWGSGCEIVAVRAAALTLTDGLKATCKQGTQVITLFLQARHAGYHLPWHYFEDVHIILRMYTLMLRMHTFYKQGTQVITFTFTYLDIILKMYHLKLSRFVLICRLWTTSSPCSNFVMHDAIAKGRPDPRTHK